MKNKRTKKWSIKVNKNTKSDSFFMNLAYAASLKSPDPSHQVGCVIVDKYKRVISVGYNGYPTEWEAEEEKWEKGKGKDNRDILDTKYPYVCHAEMNAVSNLVRPILQDCTAYVTLFPCNECAKLLIQCGIKKILYCEMGGDKTIYVASDKLFKNIGVDIKKLTPGC